MTDYHDVRDALCKMREEAYGNLAWAGPGPRVLTDWAAFSIAPAVVRALRAAESGGMKAGVAALSEPTEDT